MYTKSIDSPWRSSNQSASKPQDVTAVRMPLVHRLMARRSLSESERLLHPSDPTSPCTRASLEQSALTRVASRPFLPYVLLQGPALPDHALALQPIVLPSAWSWVCASAQRAGLCATIAHFRQQTNLESGKRIHLDFAARLWPVWIEACPPGSEELCQRERCCLAVPHPKPSTVFG